MQSSFKSRNIYSRSISQGNDFSENNVLKPFEFLFLVATYCTLLQAAHMSILRHIFSEKSIHLINRFILMHLHCIFSNWSYILLQIYWHSFYLSARSRRLRWHAECSTVNQTDFKVLGITTSMIQRMKIVITIYLSSEIQRPYSWIYFANFTLRIL